MTGTWSLLNAFVLASYVLLWVAVLFLGFLLLGTLKALGLLRWRLEQVEATMPSRLGRSGLRPGKKAPDFTLPSVAGEPITLHQFTGRKVLLVFTQTGCSPCQKIVPELNRLQTNDDLQVLMVNNGQTEATRQWANDVRAKFPVLVQNHFSLSKRFEIFATPFAFLIDEKGIIASKGVVNNLEHVGYVLSARRDAANNAPIETERSEEERPVSGNSLSPLTTEEVRHD